ncbi:hypothetical protein J27TS8_11510 [Robertmurraya siralis]|uniref:DUF2515 domain-containing protein n=1 Tax=Robertmurraya siralis TaxID=77777 RepID=A0A920BSQ2_9BACI|nr:DUF2515 domain-containing protein [Robertmurraya siralis]PAE22450.1 hypothetical protein CHH80_00345 [Bacillus sp. 7504-2]GIN61158.1 hypothetical protein J27TS8_11510 [Robertmurraya siralis]
MGKLFKNEPSSLPQSLKRIKKELRAKSKKFPQTPSLNEKKIIEKIQLQTQELNVNNVTRTKAYLDFYLKHPEIHWAFLGHMVSRNGGWNMTDLKGGLLTRLLSRTEALNFFNFLERGNWLIFQDAYPQFLLYEESLRSGKNLFYLLPFFHVSQFMETIWNDFWYYHDPSILTISLVINEQSYLEKRVIHHPTFKKEVFDSLEFMLQDILSMNHILFPFTSSGRVQLIGETLHHFQSLHERILLGKRLYKILYADQKRLQQVLQWAKQTPHTGSRKDYWPNIFNSIEEVVPGTELKRRLKGCQLTPGAYRFYSPYLTVAWKNQTHEAAELGDWYKSWKVVYYLLDDQKTENGEIENDYCKSLERLELAAIAKKAVSLLG